MPRGSANSAAFTCQYLPRALLTLVANTLAFRHTLLTITTENEPRSDLRFLAMELQTLLAGATTSTQIHPPPQSLHGGYRDDCEVCNRNFYTVAAQESGKQYYYRSFTPEEAQAEIYGEIAAAQEKYLYLQSMLQIHGDTVIRRWSKKTKDKRGATLSTAAAFCFGEWPPVPEPIFKTYDTAWHPESCRDSRYPYATWIRGKDFAEDRMRLLRLLHLRTEYSLQRWAMYDTIESDTVFAEALGVPYSPHCVKMFGEDYGRLVDFDDTMVHTCAYMSFPRALVTMRAQHGISEALCRVVDQIVNVEDTPPSGNSKWTDLMLNFDTKGNEARWSFYEHPALVPPHGFDTKVLLDKATNKFNELVDDMELLQTDPEYMLSHVLTVKASIRLKDPVPTMQKWNLVATEFMCNRISKLMQWARVVNGCRIVHQAFEKNRDSISPGITLSSDVGHAMWMFSAYVDEATESQNVHFQGAVHKMTALKDCFTIVRDGDRYKSDLLRGLDSSKDSDRIFNSALMVQRAITGRSLRGAREGIQLLLRKLQSIKYEQAVAEEISSIALIDEMRLAQIWSQLGPFEEPPEGANRFEGARATDGLRPTRARSRLIEKRLGSLLRDFCEAAWPKDHKSPSWLDKITESRRCLSAYWQAAREDWKRTHEIEGLLHPEMEPLIHSMSFDVSPEYLEQVRKEREQGEEQIRHMQAAQNRQSSASQVVQTTWGSSDSSTSGSESAPSKRTKVKTTGSSMSDLSVLALSISDSDETQKSDDHKPIAAIAVRQDSLSVFRKMFASSTGSTPGSVKWTKLVQALTDAGLVATQAPGSAVTFASHDGGAINFHKPHEPLVDALILRTMGKRLRKHFGWEGYSFVLRSKDGESLS